MSFRNVIAGVFVAAVAVGAGAQAPDLSRMDVVQKAVPDGPVAKIMGSNIPAEDFIALYLSERNSLSSQQDTPLSDVDRVKLGLYALRQLVEREILFQEAQKRGLSVTDEELQTAYTQEMGRLRQGLAKSKGSEVTEEDVLQQAGATREQALADLRKSLAVEKVRGKLVEEAGVTVSDAEVQEMFDKLAERLKHPDLVQVNHILIKFENAKGGVTDEAKAKALAQIQDALKRIQAGQNFQAVAKAVSQAPGAESGGQLPEMPANALPPFYVEAVKTMKPGDISQPIESEYGYHLIQLVEWTPAGNADLEEARPRLEKQIRAQKGAKHVATFCEEAIINSDEIEVYLQLEKILAYHPDFQLDEADAASVQAPDDGAE
jgi:parvulin-like peptidyl-prolyl isomerase